MNQMINLTEIAKSTCDGMIRNGAGKAQCRITQSEKQELNVVKGNISLFRTTFNTVADLLGLVGDKKGTVTLNKTDQDSLGKAVAEVIELAGSSKADPANDIAEYQPSKSFRNGPEQGDLDAMYRRLKEFLAYAGETYPHTLLEEINFDFTKTESVFVNSNGVEFHADWGSYNFGAMFTTKEGTQTSSFNSVGCKFKDLNTPLKDIGGIDRLLSQSARQLNAGVIPAKFEGPVIVAPECLIDFIQALTRYLSSYSMITGNSVYKDKLNQQIADSRLTLYSKPVSPEVAASSFFTEDGYETKDSAIIENGILKSFLLNLYAANKTGLRRADNRGDCNVIPAGDSSLDEMIQTTPKGILLCRFSGGNPGDNGDFSGVAKNSFYIENGEIRYPVQETMVSGNIVTMLRQIGQISQERNNDGYNLLPWIKFNGITISGK